MSKYSIKCNELDEIKWLFEVSSRQKFGVSVVSGTHKANAKSIFGVLSIDLSKGADLEVDTPVRSNIDKYIEELREKCEVIAVD